MGKFKDVSPQVNLPEMEQGVLGFWKQNKVFEKTIEQTKDGPRFVFYEGPPTANGRPGIHHVLARAFKDIFPRYRPCAATSSRARAAGTPTACRSSSRSRRSLGFGRQEGHRGVRRRGVQPAVPPERLRLRRGLGEADRADGLSGSTCPPRTVTLHERLRRVAVVDPQAVLGPRPDLQGLQGRPVLPALRHAPEQPRARAGLPGRHQGPERLRQVPAARPAGRLPAGLDDHALDPAGQRRGRGGRGHRLRAGRARRATSCGWPRRCWARSSRASWTRSRCCAKSRARSCWGCTTSRSTPSCPSTQDYCYVIPGDFVSTEDGTGLVHIAPAFGADDMEVGRKYNLPTLMTVDAQGRFIDEVDAVARHLRQGGRPADPARADRPRPDVQAGRVRAHLPVLLALRHAAALLRRARTWYIKTTAFKDRLLANNRADQLGARAHPATAVSASGWRTTSTGAWRASATGARRCRSGSATTRSATTRSASARWPS